MIRVADAKMGWKISQPTVVHCVVPADLEKLNDLYDHQILMYVMSVSLNEMKGEIVYMPRM